MNNNYSENIFFPSKGPKPLNTSNDIKSLNKNLEERGNEENASNFILKTENNDSIEPKKLSFISLDISQENSNKS